ncbi:MAG: MotB family protein [Hoeflea sp.]|uniref:MotB family protein n=1 Tax=Hoeflea sp. TaxID=1940281 RepID=UPI001E035498|nr:MotB family protein [Hoeflea sp.]MBU4528966.1 MotB family protein [Alphaproteobacteria bacterium]MBU4544099.1 MotB family protein [Alphaproteobacteria bacterium]MBU4551968.1 MotB family protein [Alphaproteobacteria bacterium]MBV1723433.1 MotB family protein [Hoeflea sp.]MBV1760412.1 MotB family protein [Hoeflea sp.]
MSDASSTHQGKNEIIIVKRRRGGEEGHHGGVWKIAYADFMTAMMAFFLVMWLVNAANEETKASVASYFNPIKLMDDKPTDRGIKEVGNSADGEATAPKSETEGQETTSGQAGEAGEKENTTAGEKADYSEADYFENPYSVLAEIAQETGTQTNISAKGDGGAQQSGPATGASGGEAYRDPFDPDFWTQQIEQERKSLEESQAMVKADGFIEAPDSVNEAGEQRLNEDAQQTAPMGNQSAEVAGEDGAGAKTDEQIAEKRERAEAEAEVLKDEIAKALGGAIGKLAEGITVTPTEGGLLVSITDQLDFGMFQVGSAVPGRDLVVAMEKIGQLLSERQGAIAIRGHTDARPFASGNDDNWRLSMARAHSALFMLVRGGVPEERIVQVSGFADKRLKDPENPLSEVNRRIEILVEAEGS